MPWNLARPRTSENHYTIHDPHSITFSFHQPKTRYQSNHSEMAEQSTNSLAAASITTLAVLRMLVGASTLLVPGRAGPPFGIPITAPTMILGRLFGVRDLVIGGLLWSAPSHSTATIAVNGECRRTLRRALVVGLIIDTVDVCSNIVGFVDGTLEPRAIVGVGVGAAFFAGLGLLGLRGLELKDGKE